MSETLSEEKTKKFIRKKNDTEMQKRVGKENFETKSDRFCLNPMVFCLK